MTQSNQLLLQLSFDSSKIAGHVGDCIGVELNQDFEHRSRTRLTRNGKQLILELDAQDRAAMRASFHTVMQGIALTAKVFDSDKKIL